MLIQNNLKSKSYSISAVMKNKKLSSAIGDALKSPLGSTKREKARSILRTVSRVSQNPKYFSMDGQGGAVDWYSPFGQQNPTATGSLSNTATQPKPQPTQPVPASKNVFLNNQTQPTGTTPPTAENTGVISSNQVVARPAFKPLEYVTSQPSFETAVTTPSFIQPPTPTVPTPPTDSVIKPDVKSVLGTKTTETTEMPEGQNFSINDNGDIDYTDSSGQTSTIPKSLQDQYPGLFEAVQAGIGAKTWSYQIMSDKEKMKQLFPGMPEDSFPVGASLARNLDSLEATLKKQFNVDGYLDALNQKKATSLDFTKDVTGYITARDEYLADVDKLIDKTHTSMLGMDMGNPEVAKRMNNYNNYLYVLKGRQTKRYGDWLKTSIDDFNNELTFAQNQYDSAYAKFSDMYKTKAAITSEDIKTAESMLKDMYDNLDGRELKSEQLYKIKLDNKKTYAELMKDSIDAFGIPMTDTQELTAYNNYVIANPDKGRDDWSKMSLDEKNRFFGQKPDDEAKWQLEGEIWKWLAEPGNGDPNLGGKDLTNKEKKEWIQKLGFDPETFKIY